MLIEVIAIIVSKLNDRWIVLFCFVMFDVCVVLGFDFKMWVGVFDCVWCVCKCLFVIEFSKKVLFRMCECGDDVGMCKVCVDVEVVIECVCVRESVSVVDDDVDVMCVVCGVMKLVSVFLKM